MFPEYAIQLQDVDAIVTGDGEDTFLEMVQAFDEGRSFEGIEGVWYKEKDGSIQKNPEKSTKNLTAYPWPRQKKEPVIKTTTYQEPNNQWLQLLLQVEVVLTPVHFVSHIKQYRIRDFDNILDEIEDCVSLGITEVHFIDDLFTPNSQWVLQFCDEIERRRGLKFNWGYKTTIAGTTRTNTSVPKNRMYKNPFWCKICK